MTSNPALLYSTVLNQTFTGSDYWIRQYRFRQYSNRDGSQQAKAMSTPQRISVADSGNVTVVTFNDSKIIDEQEIQELGQELYNLVEQDARKKMVLNFAKVEFMSSAALGKLIGFEKKARIAKAKLILTNIRPEIYEVFAITKLTKLFTIKDDEADALAIL